MQAIDIEIGNEKCRDDAVVDWDSCHGMLVEFTTSSMLATFFGLIQVKQVKCGCSKKSKHRKTTVPTAIYPDIFGWKAQPV